MRPLIHRFSDIWRTDLGHKVRVELQDAPDVSQEANFRPRRIAVVQRTPLVHPGTVIFGQGTAFLLIGQVSLAELDRFRALEITDFLPWVRMGLVPDPVTGFMRRDVPQVLHSGLPCVVEPIRTVKDMGIERAKIRIMTGAAVGVKDKLGAFQVHSILPHLGVHLLETI